MLSIQAIAYGGLIQKIAAHNNFELKYSSLRIGFGTLKATEVYIKPSNFPGVYLGSLKGRFNIFTGNFNFTSTTDSHDMFIYSNKKDNYNLWAGYIAGQDFFDWFFPECNISAKGRVEFNMTGTPGGFKTDNIYTAKQIEVTYKGESRLFKDVILHFSFDREVGEVYELTSSGDPSVNASGLIEMDQKELINSNLSIQGISKEKGVSRAFSINGKLRECPSIDSIQ